MELSEIITKIQALESRASELLDKAEGAPTEDVKALRQTVETEIVPEIQRLQDARKEAEREEEVKALRAKVGTLDEAIEALRQPMGDFSIGSGKSIEAIQEEASPYDEGRSFYADVKAAGKGNQEAQERLAKFGVADGKAMTEGDLTGLGHTYGGYLVEKQIERQIVEARELDNVLRGLCSKLNVTSTELQLDQISLATTAGWVAELAEKPEATSMARTTVSATIFQAAGLATISNQLLADSNPAVDRLVTADLAKRLVALEEAAFLAGSGTGQPLGLLNTPGIQAQGNAVVGVTADGGLLDSILDAISLVQAEHGEPTAIVMHPRTWTRILKAKDAQGLYIAGPPTFESPRQANRSLFGVRVVTSNRVPTNLGAGTNESRVIVGDFSEALILDRQGITVDESQHVKFTSNQTIFRAEQRVGFTAARAPKAFAVVGGTGLANG
jgi:HK97 family phage major capsid protein